MICQACRDHHHGECRGGSWCDCQHQATPATRDGPPGPPPDPGAEGGPRDGEGAAGRSEPPVNWKRQG
ncbi:hypothetical protein [Actinomadura vinacea]|uniref:hypothetical protein n=1 Tax=Actinomadura vinacea TaxID=115336 RepID=UPI0031DAB088